MATAPKKLSQLDTITSVAANDYVVVVHDPLGNPVSAKITYTNMMANVAVPATFKANVTFSTSSYILVNHLVSSNLTVNTYYTPATSSESAQKGKIWFDNTYLYIAVDNDTIKRIPLQSF